MAKTELSISRWIIQPVQNEHRLCGTILSANRQPVEHMSGTLLRVDFDRGQAETKGEIYNLED